VPVTRLLRISAGGAGAASKPTHSLVGCPGAMQPSAAPWSVLVVKLWLMSKLVGGVHCSFSGHATRPTPIGPHGRKKRGTCYSQIR